MIPLAALALLAAPPSGDAVIRAKAGPSDIVVTTTRRLAGAVHSLTWHGREFIDSYDHGRQLQSAASFDCARPGEFWAECFNPTEAGSHADDTGPRSTSKLLDLKLEPNRLDTTTRMAFWLAPGQKSAGRPALNTEKLSNHLVRKRIALGAGGLPHAIEYVVTFTVPADERHTLAQFEAVTGYMPPAFDTFHAYDRDAGRFAPLSDGPGEQDKPVVFSTGDGTHAMGAIAFDTPAGSAGPGYGRFRFKQEKVVKWNVVYRVRHRERVPAGEYTYRVFLAVGSLENVRVTLNQLAEKYGRK